MRNLKRVLALAMAMVMILGMMVIGTSAASYTDAAAIDEDYAEAVEILSGMGVFKGTGAGFAPKQILTRAEAAALVYRVITGDVADKQVDLYDFSTFADVEEGKWYTPYITYAANGGYIKGYNGNAMPNDTVTGIQVLAMMLRAAGYGQNGEFEGAAWKDGILTVAKEQGIIAGISTNDLDKGATRELVAKLIWNAVSGVDMVNYNALLGYTKVNIGTFWEPEYQTLGQKVFNLAKTTDEDNWGRPATVWYAETNKVADKQPTETLYATIAATPDAVYTVATSQCDIAKDLGLRAPATVDSITINSVENDIDSVISLTSMAKIGAQGQLVEFYYNAKEKNYDVVIIDTYLAKVTDVEVVEYDKNGHISDYAELDLEVYTGTTATDVTLYAVTDWAYAENDMLLVYYDTAAYSALKGAVIPYAEIQGYAESVVGTQSAYVYNADSHIVEDVEYLDAAEFNLDEAGSDALNKHNWYFDQYGNLIGATDVRTTSTYATISSIYWQNSFGGELGYAKAVLTYMDGTQETVKVAAIKHYGKDTATTLTSANGNGNYALGNVSTTMQYNEAVYNEDGTLDHQNYDYTNRALYAVVPGYYGATLVEVSSKAVTIETGVPALATGVVAGTSTQFLVWDEYYDEYKTYTGIRNVPTYEGTTTAYYVNGRDGIVDYIFVIDPTDAAENTTATYYHTGNLSVKTYLYSTYEYYYVISGGYVNGEAASITTFDPAVVETIADDCANTVVKLSLKNGYVQKVENWADNAQISVVTKEKIDYAGAIGAGTAVTTDDATLADGILTIGGVSYDVVDAAIINAYRSSLEELFDDIDDDDVDPNEAFVYVIYKEGTVSNKTTKVATLIYVSKKAPGTVGKTATDAATAKLNAAKATAVAELKAYINTKAQAADTTDKLAADFDATTSTETAIGEWTFKALFDEHAAVDLGTAATSEAVLATNLAECKKVWDKVDYTALITAEANKTTVSSAAALVSALASDTADSVITLGADVSVAADALALNGGVLNGGNKTLTITGYDETSGTAEVDLAVKVADGGTIKNITIDGGVTGINISNPTVTNPKLVLDNVTVVNSARALNGGSGVAAYLADITVTNSTFAGKISYIAKTVTFTNTSFVVNEELVKGNVLEPYTTTVLDGCTFEYGFELSLADLNTGYDWNVGQTVTLKNCYVDDILVTEANVEALLGVAASAVTITNG